MNRVTKIALTVSAIAIMSWCVGWITYASAIPNIVSDATTKTDAIVVLTGGRGRVEEGVALLQQGLAAKLFVSGTGGRTQVPDLLPDNIPMTPEIQAAISLGREAEDTPGNATETAAWVQRENITSLRLVTAAYHMPRSLLELQAAMPKVRIVTHPVFPSNVKADWWRWPGTASLIAREYSKFLISWIRISVAGGAPAPDIP